MNDHTREPSDATNTFVEEKDLTLDPLPPPPASLTSHDGFPSRHALPSLPGFEILCELGRGGMGRVFKARQLRLNRIVAVKMLHVAEFAVPEERERFLSEAQALAALQHPHIVQIFEVGEDRDRPFLVMECLEGGSLDKRLRGQPVAPGAAADLVATLAGAVDYVHHRGLLHRDLKLANVLIDSGPNGPLQPDKIKLTDFGLAKRMVGDRTGSMPSRAIAGTPNYMAPEQAAGQPASPASDVYSLGAVLYQLMTGRPPFTGPTWMDTLSQVIGSDPAPPRRLVPSLPRDLETICLKCLQKEPAQRYQSAGELAEDLQRFSKGLPIQARPVGPIERIRKWARRHPAIAALCAFLAISVATGVTLVTWKWQEALSANARAAENFRNELKARELFEAERIQGEVLRREAVANRIRGYASLIAQADRAWQMGSMERCQELLNQCPEDLRNWEWYLLYGRFHEERPVIRASGFAARQVAFRSDGKLMATAGGKLEDVHQDGVIKIWDPATGKLLFDLEKEHKGPVTWLAFHPNNRWLISLSLRFDWLRIYKGDATAFHEAEGECVLWDLEQKRSLVIVPGKFGAGALSSDGMLFAAAGSDRQTRIWRLDATGPWKEVAKLPAYAGLVKTLAFSPDGKLLARSGTHIQGIEHGEMKYTPELKLFRTVDGSEEGTLPIPHVEIEAVVFAPDGHSLAWTNGTQNTVTLWDLQANRALRSFFGHRAPIQALTFNKEGAELATGGQDRLVKIWDVASGRELRTLRGHDVSVECLAFAPANLEAKRRLASAGGDGTVRFWNPEVGQAPLTLAGHRMAVTQALFSPDGLSIASRGAGGVVRIWDAATGGVRFEMDCGAERMAWSPDSKWLLTGGGDHRAVQKPGELVVWNAATGQRVQKLAGHKRYVMAVAWSPDGAHFASIDGDPFNSINESGELILWNSKTFTKENTWKPPAGCIGDIAFSPDGAHLAAASFDNSVYVFDPANGKTLTTFSGHENPVHRIAYSRDGARLASGDMSGMVRIWNVASGETEHVLRAASGAIGGLCFNSRGDRLATASFDLAQRDLGMITLWDVRSGHEILQLRGQLTVNFSRDDRYLAVASPGGLAQPGSIYILDAKPANEVAAFSTGGIAQFEVAISPEGRRLAVAIADTGYDGRVSLFDWATRREIATLPGSQNLIMKVAFDPSNDNRLATGHQRGLVSIWDIRRRTAIVTFQAHTGLVTRILYGPDGRTIATSGQDKTIKLWDAATGTPIASWEAHDKRINDLAFSPDGTKLASASGDKSVRIWNCADQREIHRFDNLPDWASSIAWNADGSLLAVGGNFPDIFVWDPDSGELRHKLAGHEGPVRSLTFSPDGKLLVSGGDDQTVRVWNARTGTPLAVNRGHFGLVRSVAVHPHLPMLMSASFDLSIRIWRMPIKTEP